MTEKKESTKIKKIKLQLKPQKEENNHSFWYLEISQCEFDDDKKFTTYKSEFINNYVYFLDYPINIIELKQDFNKKIKLCQKEGTLNFLSAGAIKYKMEDSKTVSNVIEAQKQYKNYYQQIKKFFVPDTTDDSNKCTLESLCSNVSENLCTDDQLCPKNNSDTIRFLSSDEHKQELERFYQKINYILSSTNVDLILTLYIKKDKYAYLLNFLDWEIMTSYIPKLSNSDNKCFVVRGVSSDYTKSITLTEIDPIDQLEILVIYLNNPFLNNLHDEDSLNNQDSKNKKSSTSKPYISLAEHRVLMNKSNEQWSEFDRNINEIRVNYLICKNNQKEIQEALKDKRYHMIVIKGHGMDEYENIKIGNKNTNELNTDYLIRSLGTVKDLQLVCLLMCESDTIAKKIIQLNIASLVVACNGLLAVEKFNEFEEKLHNIISVSQAKQNPVAWVKIFSEALSDIQGVSYVGDISLNSMKIYSSSPNLYFKYQNKYFINRIPGKKFPSRPTNPPTKKQILIFVLIFSLIAFFLGIKTHKFRKTSIYNLKQNLVSISIPNDKDKKFSGFLIFNKLTNKKSNRYRYYFVTSSKVIDISKKNNLKITLIKNGESITKDVKTIQLVKSKELADKGFAIYGFDIAKPIWIQHLAIEKSEFSHQIGSSQKLRLWGYEKEESNPRIYVVNSYIDIIVRKEVNSGQNRKLIYNIEEKQNKNIPEEFIGGPLVVDTNSNCIVGMHLENPTKKSNQEKTEDDDEIKDDDYHKGQLTWNLFEIIENTKDTNPELEEIYNFMKKNQCNNEKIQ